MSNEAPTDALRLVQAIRDWLREPDNAESFSFNDLVEWLNRRPVGLVMATLEALAAAPASPPAYVRTPNEDDRLRRALYRLLERHGAGPDPLSVIGSLWDTLDQGECTDLIEDWLITGKVIQVEGDIDEMLASIPKEAPASPLTGGGCLGAEHLSAAITRLTQVVAGDKVEAAYADFTFPGHTFRADVRAVLSALPAAPTGAK